MSPESLFNSGYVGGREKYFVFPSDRGYSLATAWARVDSQSSTMDPTRLWRIDQTLGSLLALGLWCDGKVHASDSSHFDDTCPQEVGQT